jgi:hypothetical protein
MPRDPLYIGQRVNIRGRGGRLFVIVDFNDRESTVRVTEIINDPNLGQTNGETEWVHKDKVEQAQVVYTQFQYYPNITAFKQRFKEYEQKAKPKTKRMLKIIDSALRKAIQNKDRSWFPTPEAFMPRSIKEMREKTSWNDKQMALYYEFKAKYMDDFMSEIRFNSLAEVKQDEFVYNDRQLGEFDFARASIGLNKRFQYYSPTHEKVVAYDEVEILGSDGNYEYKLKSDGTEVIIQEETDAQGRPKFYSTVKKCYLMKEKVPRPRNAVRIFLYQGGSGGVSAEGVGYPAMLAVALTEILESIGYSVSFISGWDACQYSSGTTGINKGTAETPDYVHGERYVMYSVKSFEENLNLPELLYLTSSYALYQWDFWKGMFLTFDHYNDMWEDVGYLGSYNNWRQSVYSTFMPRDVNKGVIYLTIPKVTSIAAVKEEVRKIIQYTEEVNQREREKLLIQGT